MDEFLSLGLNPQLQRACTAVGYTKPTPIQAKAIPLLLQGHDLLGIAQTGTGKTAAYVLPLLMKLKYAQGQHPRALILAPTRELAMQIEENIIQFAKYTDLRTVVLYGGLGPKTQIAALEKGADILVATPGRFLDLYLAGHIVTKSIQFLVLDEADKMMDMGFIGSIHRILEVVPRKRQNLLFSATMSELVHKISGDFLKFPLIIEVAAQATPAHTVSQVLYRVPNLKTKLNLLQELLKDDERFHRLIDVLNGHEPKLRQFITRKLLHAFVIHHAKHRPQDSGFSHLTPQKHIIGNRQRRRKGQVLIYRFNALAARVIGRFEIHSTPIHQDFAMIGNNRPR